MRQFVIAAIVAATIAVATLPADAAPSAQSTAPLPTVACERAKVLPPKCRLTTPPDQVGSIAVASPTSGAAVAGSFLVTGTATDGDGIVGVAFRVAGSSDPWEACFRPDAGSFECHVNYGGGLGSFGLEVAETDALGNGAVGTLPLVRANASGQFVAIDAASLGINPAEITGAGRVWESIQPGVAVVSVVANIQQPVGDTGTFEVTFSPTTGASAIMSAQLADGTTMFWVNVDLATYGGGTFRLLYDGAVIDQQGF